MSYPILRLDFDRDFAGYVRLSQAVYGARAVTDPALYRWLFEDNPFNPAEHFFHIAKDGPEVIASDGLVPIPLAIEGKNYLAAWSIKTMTHPHYQRQGIFRAITEFGLDRAKTSGLNLVLGFANSQSFPGYEKFGWNLLLERRAVIKPLDIERALLKRFALKSLARAGNSLFRGWDKRRIKALAQESDSFEIAITAVAPSCLDDLWQQMKGAAPVQVIRNCEYIDWRYNRRPHQDYRFALASKCGQPQALLIFRETSKKSCLLVDYVGAPQSAALAPLVLCTITHCRERGLQYILSSAGISFDRSLKLFGFKRLTTALVNNMLIACPLGQLALAPLRSENNWFFSYGDSELDIDLQPLPRKS